MAVALRVVAVGVIAVAAVVGTTKGGNNGPEERGALDQKGTTRAAWAVPDASYAGIDQRRAALQLPRRVGLVAGPAGDAGGTPPVRLPPVGGGAVDYGSARSLICSYPWPCSEALAVWECESSGRWWVVSGDNWGGFQISAVHAWRVGYDLPQLLDPAVNTRVAFEIWSEQGWTPWACQPW